MNCTLTSTVQRYIDHLANHRRVTDKSLKNYRSTCETFAQWAIANGRTLESETIQDFVSRYDHAASANTHRVRLVGLARFAEVPVSVVRAKEPVREVEALSSEELDRLLTVSSSLDKELNAGVVFLARTGLRFDEFCRTSQADVFTKKGRRFLAVEGKGRKQRTVPLTDEAFKALRALPERTPMFEKKFRRHLATAGKRAKISCHVHPHLLRASFISIHLNEKGTQAIHVATIVGHSSVDTMLKHYFKPDFAALHDMM